MRECRDLKRANRLMKRVGGLIVVAAVLLTMFGAQLSQRIEEIRAGSILMVDKGGYPRVRSLPPLQGRTEEPFFSSATRLRSTRRSF